MLDRTPEAYKRKIDSHRRTYEMNRARGICVFCRTRQARPGLCSCEACAEKLNEYAARRRAELIASHICPECGKLMRPTENRKTCFACRLKRAERAKARYCAQGRGKEKQLNANQ